MSAVIHYINPRGLHTIKQAIAERCLHVEVSEAYRRKVVKAARGASEGGHRVGSALTVAYKLLRKPRVSQMDDAS